MTQKETLYSGVRYLFGSIPLFFLGPSVIHNALMNKQNNWHYLVLVFGIIFCILAAYCMFRGLRLIINSIFNK